MILSGLSGEATNAQTVESTAFPIYDASIVQRLDPDTIYPIPPGRYFFNNSDQWWYAMSDGIHMSINRDLHLGEDAIEKLPKVEVKAKIYGVVLKFGLPTAFVLGYYFGKKL